MYSLVVAEDEKTTRRGLTELVDWNAMGFTLAAAFSDGQETVEYLKDHAPDVLLTDIRMIRVDGLAVARYVAERGLPTRVLLLTGYKSFEYAQSAVDYHVERYLLKPITVPELRRVFAELKQSLDEEGLRRARLHNLVSYETRQFASDALLGRIARGAFEARLKLLEPFPDGEAPQCLRFRLRFDGREVSREAVEQALARFDERMAFVPISWTEGILEGAFLARREDAPKIARAIERRVGEETGVAAALEPLEWRALEQLAPRDDAPEENVARLRAYVRAHFAEDVTLAKAARAVGLNPAYASRLFKEKTGVNFIDCLTEARVEAAVRYLEQGDRYVYEVAELVGYRNIKYFYRVFKKVKGYSPGDCRGAKRQV